MQKFYIDNVQNFIAGLQNKNFYAFAQNSQEEAKKKIELSSLIQKKIYLSCELFEWQVQSLLKIAHATENQNMINQMEMKLVEQNLIWDKIQ